MTDRRTVQIAGLPVQVVDNAEAERAALVMCAPATMPAHFPDDVIAACAWCGCAIRHRPHVPKKPPKVCMGCAFARMQQEHDH